MNLHWLFRKEGSDAWKLILIKGKVWCPVNKPTWVSKHHMHKFHWSVSHWMCCSVGSGSGIFMGVSHPRRHDTDTLLVRLTSFNKFNSRHVNLPPIYKLKPSHCYCCPLCFLCGVNAASQIMTPSHRGAYTMLPAASNMITKPLAAHLSCS